MKYSLKVGRPFGIKISIHWTFLLLILWIVAVNVNQGANISQILWSVFFILVLFVCVTLHELGHSLAARKYNIETKSITLLPIGGMANIEGMPEKPKQEIVVTLSGLMVNVVIAGILWVIISTIPAYSFDIDLTTISGKNFLVMLMYVNLFIVAFNLIPAFPMDGGRVLRAALSFRFDRVKATKYSMIAGQIFGAMFAIFGLFVNPFLFIIGVFVFLGAQFEYKQVKFRSLLFDYKVRDLVMKDYRVLDPQDELKKAVEILLQTRQTGFLVKKNEKEFVGVLLKDQIIDGLSKYGREGKVEDVMIKDYKKIDADTLLKDLFQQMQREKTDMFPVFDDHKLIGVIDMENIQEFIMVQSALHDEK